MKHNQEPILLFTYGTMRKNCYNNGRIGKAKFICEGVTCEPFIMVAKDNPRQVPYVGRVPSDDRLHGQELPVVGEVYLLDRQTLAIVDRAEGHPFVYERETCSVRLFDGTITKAFIYVHEVSEGVHEFVPTGDFLDYYDEEIHLKQGHNHGEFFDKNSKQNQMKFTYGHTKKSKGKWCSIKDNSTPSFASRHWQG